MAAEAHCTATRPICMHDLGATMDVSKLRWRQLTYFFGIRHNWKIAGQN